MDTISKWYQRKTAPKGDDDDDSDYFDVANEDSQYAPLFGRYWFHLKIYGLRSLWRYRYMFTDSVGGVGCRDGIRLPPASIYDEDRKLVQGSNLALYAQQAARNVRAHQR